MEETHEQEAAAMLASTVETVTALFDRIDGDDTEDSENARMELGELHLSLEYSEDQDRVRLILCTGGPHEEISWHQRPYASAKDVVHVYMPWFGRVETRDLPDVIQRLADYWADIIDPEDL